MGHDIVLACTLWNKCGIRVQPCVPVLTSVLINEN